MELFISFYAVVLVLVKVLYCTGSHQKPVIIPVISKSLKKIPYLKIPYFKNPQRNPLIVFIPESLYKKHCVPHPHKRTAELCRSSGIYFIPAEFAMDSHGIGQL